MVFQRSCITQHHPALQIVLWTDVHYIVERQINVEIDWNVLNDFELNIAVETFYSKLNQTILKFTPLAVFKRNYPTWYSSDLFGHSRRKSRARSKRKKTNSDLNMSFELFEKIFWSFTKGKRQANTYHNELTYNNARSTHPPDMCQTKFSSKLVMMQLQLPHQLNLTKLQLFLKQLSLYFLNLMKTNMVIRMAFPTSLPRKPEDLYQFLYIYILLSLTNLWILVLFRMNSRWPWWHQFTNRTKNLTMS